MTFAGACGDATRAPVCHVLATCAGRDPAKNGNGAEADQRRVHHPGDAHHRPLLETLHADGYAGWLVVEAEQDPAVAPSYHYAKMGHDHLRALVGEVEHGEVPGARRRAASAV
jgi:sugar phosphate isomerase/epimerase